MAPVYDIAVTVHIRIITVFEGPRGQSIKLKKTSKSEDNFYS